MKNTRRDFIKVGAAAGAVGVLGSRTAAQAALSERLDKALAAPILKTELFKQPVKIAAIELLKNGKQYLIRARATDGATGISCGHGSVLRSTAPIMLNRIIPYLVGKDARELEQLLRGVYLHESNYKWQGLAFWVCVASVELAILDLLGKVAHKPLGELLGGVVRREIPVYRASGNRGNTPEKEIEYLQKVVAETGARAIKFRLGGRFHFNEETTRRDYALIKLTRKTFGEGMAIYADANSSYDIPMSIKIGRAMEEQKLAFFEEPVPFDYLDETKAVADQLSIPIAWGECETSTRRFRWAIENNMAQIMQPDLMYFGGIIRSIQVARMAAAAGLDCTPHMSGGDLGYLYVAHFASCVPNAGPHQEYKGEDETLPVTSESSSLKSEKGVLKVPSGPGLGIVIDPEFVSKAKAISG
jgi:L-alanine-DL-glutamate epimerase-like enolase superfamily enzyme